MWSISFHYFLIMFLDEAALISRKVDVEPAHQISQPYTFLSNNRSCWVSEALAWAISKQFSQTELRSHMLIKPQIRGPGDHLRAGPPPPPRSVKPAETGKHKREMEHNAPAESPPQSAHCSHCISICATETLLKLWPCHATALRGRCVRFSLSLLLCDFSFSAFTSFDRESGLQGCQVVFCAHISHTLQK